MMEWIKCSERKPKDDDLVLVTTRDFGWFIAFYMSMGRVLDEGWWRHTDDGCVEKLERPLFWQYLPESPEEETNV